MAPKRARNARRRSRGAKAGKAKASVSEPVGIRLLRTLTSLSFYTRLPSPETGEAKNTWLGKLWQYGVIAFKLALSILTVETDGALTAPVGATQAIAITPDTLVYSSPLTCWRSFTTGPDKPTYQSQSFGYRQLKVKSVHIRITPGAILKDRAGRMSAAIIPLTWAESNKIQSGSNTDYADYTFLDIVKMPGAVTVPATRTLSLVWKPRLADWGDEWVRVGQQETPVQGEVPNGGMPLAVLLYGYQDLAAPKPTVDQLYAADEALYNLDIRAQVSCREYGDSWLRPLHRTLQDPATVSVSVPGAIGAWNVPISAFRVVGDKLTMAKEYVTGDVTRALTNSEPFMLMLGKPAQALSPIHEVSEKLGFVSV